MAAAITRGAVTVEGVIPAHLDRVVEKLDAAGCDLHITDNSVCVAMRARPRHVDVSADPYPGIPTDLQAQWMALLSLARGHSTISDQVFPSRFMHAAELGRLGAIIRVGGGSATVDGVDRLRGARVAAMDLRGSAALALAGLAAENQTIVERVHHLDRGYDRLEQKLISLGAKIERVALSAATRRTSFCQAR
jgi:UDP-N-acetylglucosamine 1-carboxyvinyltransferase